MTEFSFLGELSQISNGDMDEFLWVLKYTKTAGSFRVKSTKFQKLPQLKCFILLIFFWRKINMYSEESQNMQCHGCILIYWVIHYFVEGGQNDHFQMRFRARLQEDKMISERVQHHCYFYTEIGRSIVKSVDFGNLCCIICQWWPFHNRKKHFSL